MSYEGSANCCRLILCDNGNDNFSFMRRFEQVCPPGQPVETVTVDTELDGETPYVVIGDPVVCAGEVLNQFEGLVTTPLCDGTTGLPVGFMVVEKSEEDPPISSVSYYDTAGNSIPAAPANSGICPQGVDYEYKWVEECFQDQLDASIRFRRMSCVPIVNGIVGTTAIILWFDENGDISPPPPGPVDFCTSEECLKNINLMCYTTEPECLDAPTNDYGAWQGGLGDQPVTSTQVLCTGETLNITWDNFVAGQIVNSAITNPGELSILVSGGPGATETLTLAWDQPLVGPLAFIIRNVSPGDEDVPIITPAPTTISPLFGVGDTSTEHQVYYEDVTGINQIDIDLEVITQASGTFIVYMDPSVELTVVPTETILVSVTADTCIEPPVLSVYNVETQEEITDPEIIKTLRVCTDLAENDCSNPLHVEACIFSWSELLCDIRTTVEQVTLIVTDTALESVNLVDGLDGTVLATHSEPGVNWTNGSFYDSTNQFYYVYDLNSAGWFRYDALNLAAGPTNLGPFGGDPLVVNNGLTFGAYNPDTQRGMVGEQANFRYEIDPTLMTVTALPAWTGAIGQPSSLSINNDLQYIVGSISGGTTRLYTANPITGVLTLIDELPAVVGTINGAGYEKTNDTGYYGINGGTNTLYRWRRLDGSDVTAIGIPGTLPSSGTMDVVDSIAIDNVITEFYRVYHKNLITGEITIQDHSITGGSYTVIGIEGQCILQTEPTDIFNSPGIDEINQGETWTNTVLPAGATFTGVTMTVVSSSGDNSVTDGQGNVVTNIPTGTTLTWNVDPGGNLTAPTIFAGSGATDRILVHYTYRL